MIRTEAEYQEALLRIQRDTDVAEQQRAALKESGLVSDRLYMYHR